MWSNILECLVMLTEGCKWQKVSNVGVCSGEWARNNQEICEGEWIEIINKTEIYHSRDYKVVGNEYENLEEVRKEFLERKEMLENEHLG